jgi:negative regulator of genetic competence, sporulation and motility
MSKESVTRKASTTILNNDTSNDILDKQLRINQEVKELKKIIDEMAKFTEEKNETENQLNENMDDLEEKEKQEKQKKLSKRYNQLQIKIQYQDIKASLILEKIEKINSEH